MPGKGTARRMTNQWILLFLMLGSAISVLSPIAHAESVQIIANGPPAPAGSWIQNFDIVDGFFDMVEIFIVNDFGGGPFEAPALTNIVDLSGNDGIWTATLINPAYVLATGTPSFWINADLHLSGNIGSAITLDFLFWDRISLPGETLLADSVRLNYDPSTGSYPVDVIPVGETYVRDPGGPLVSEPVPTPEPATLLLLASGLAGLAALGAKRRK
jgi:hypothetical protein